MKQKKMYEGQRDQLYNQQFNVENTAFALQSAKDNIETVAAMQAASKELKTTVTKNKMLDIGKIDRLNDDLADLMVCVVGGWVVAWMMCVIVPSQPSYMHP